MSNYPPSFTADEQSRYFDTPPRIEHDDIGERAYRANEHDKWTDPDVIAWRLRRALDLRALRRRKP